MKQGKIDLLSGEVTAARAEADRAALASGEEPLPARRAKIVCTVGPSSNTEEVLRDLLRLGMDVARLNFSHGSHAEHARNIERIRRAAHKEGRTVCILQDLQGPKIRTGKLKGHTPVMLEAGATVTITPRPVLGTSSLIATTFENLAREVVEGARILLSDGLIELRVRRIVGDDIECDVVNGGLLGEHKGINLPGVALRIPALTEKDRADLEFGLDQHVDVIAISFVRSAADVREVKTLIASHGRGVPVVAKLEKPQAIEYLEEIFEEANGVMIARGDLGVEVPPEQVPIIQKHVIRRAAEWRRPVITATQMLESMIENPRPTRAEASDVANAVFDGTDAVMLSAETASGRYPREAVAMMSRIVAEAERNMAAYSEVRRRRQREHVSVAEAICESIAQAAEVLPMGAIAVFTETGNTARMISKYRPRVPIYAFSQFPAVCNRLNILWGVHPMPRKRRADSAEDMVMTAECELLAQGRIQPGQVLGVVAGTQMSSGSTNFMRLHTVPPADEVRTAKPRHQRARKN